MKKFIFLFFIFVCAFFLLACDKDNKEKMAVDSFSIKVDEYIGINKTYELKAFDRKGNKIEVEWTVDDDSLASIEGNTIKGLSNGIITVTATYQGVPVEAFCVVDNVKTIKYELDGGTCDNLEEEIFESKVYKLPTPVKEGFNFLGWYSNQSFSGSPVTELDSKNFTISTLYASWHSEEYEIKYIRTQFEEMYFVPSLKKHLSLFLRIRAYYVIMIIRL